MSGGLLTQSSQAAGLPSTAGTQTGSMPDWAVPTAKSYLQSANYVADLPYQAFTGTRYAGLNGTQQQAIGAVQQRALNGSPVMNTASSALQQTAGGQYLNQQAAVNPYLNASNPFAQQDNPYLQQNIDAAMQDMRRNYDMSVAPQLDRLGAQSGSFGNSGVQQMQLEAGRQLAQTMGNTAAGMRMADYGQRAQLAENFANRQFQGGQAAATAQNALYDSERSRMMSALGLAPTFANQDYTDAQQLLNAGTLQQADQQKGMDWNFQQWQDAQNYPYKQLQTLGGALGIQFNSAQPQTPQQPSRTSSALGNAMMGYALTGSPWGAAAGGLAGWTG